MSQPCLTAFIAIAILFITQGVYAKRGCSSFGHSCFGGHGKRSGDTMSVEMPDQQELLSARLQAGQKETAPHPEYPRSNINGILPINSDGIIPIRDGGAYDHDENNAIKEIMKYRLRNIVKYWMDNYRRSQQNSGEGLLMNML